jgi:predicted RNase H-like nuclease (RuvC/YqgF family)
MSNQNNTTNLDERQEHNVKAYKRIHNHIALLDNQITEMINTVNHLQNELDELREQEKKEFNYGKEE